MKDQDYIADLFREGLENHEVPVRPEIWQNVASRIDTPATFTDATQVTNPAAVTIKAAAGIKAWIAGTAIVLTGAAGIVAYTYLKNPEVASEPPVQQTETALVSGSETIHSPGAAHPATGTDQLKEQNQENRNLQQNQSGEIGNDPQTVSDTHPQDRSAEGAPSGVSVNETPGGQATDKPAAGSQFSTNTGQEVKNSLPVEQTPAAQPASSPWQLKIHADLTEGTAPFETNFYVSASSGTAEWVFEENSPAKRGLAVRHRFEKPGRYKVTCRFTDMNGVVSMENIDILVKPSFALSPVPNVFSPNGDGLNDEFAVRSLEGLEIELTVFDPSGKTIHRSKGTEATWNGRVNGVDESPEGTYFYVIFASGQLAVKGTVTLKR